MATREKLARIGFALLAAPLVLATGWSIATRSRRLGFGALLADLRAARARPLPRLLRKPQRLAETVERLLGVVPPRAYGLCLRRTLILLELWSRCGIEPKLHLGFRLERPERSGHAWLTGIAADGSRLQVSGPNGTEPAFEV